MCASGDSPRSRGRRKSVNGLKDMITRSPQVAHACASAHACIERIGQNARNHSNEATLTERPELTKIPRMTAPQGEMQASFLMGWKFFLKDVGEPTQGRRPARPYFQWQTTGIHARIEVWIASERASQPTSFTGDSGFNDHVVADSLPRR